MTFSHQNLRHAARALLCRAPQLLLQQAEMGHLKRSYPEKSNPLRALHVSCEFPVSCPRSQVLNLTRNTQVRRQRIIEPAFAGGSLKAPGLSGAQVGGSRGSGDEARWFGAVGLERVPGSCGSPQHHQNTTKHRAPPITVGGS